MQTVYVLADEYANNSAATTVGGWKQNKSKRHYNNRSKNNRKTVCRLVSSFVVLGHRIFPDSLFDFSTLFVCLPSLAVYSCASPDIVIVGLRHPPPFVQFILFSPLRRKRGPATKFWIWGKRWEKFATPPVLSARLIIKRYSRTSLVNSSMQQQHVSITVSLSEGTHEPFQVSQDNAML